MHLKQNVFILLCLGVIEDKICNDKFATLCIIIYVNIRLNGHFTVQF